MSSKPSKFETAKAHTPTSRLCRNCCVWFKVELDIVRMRTVAAVVWIFAYLTSMSLAHLMAPSIPSLSLFRGGSGGNVGSPSAFARGGGNVEMRKKFEELCRDAQVVPCMVSPLILFSTIGIDLSRVRIDRWQSKVPN
jgi:hypothetical protein